MITLLFGASIDIHDAMRYNKDMMEYDLGPNLEILTFERFLRDEVINPNREILTWKNHAIQESICGLLLEEVVGLNREFYVDPRISVGQVDATRSDHNVS